MFLYERSKPVALEDRYNLEDLNNHAERLVFDEIERLIEEGTISKPFQDEETILDIAAFALNQTKPMYRATLLGRIYEPDLEDKNHEKISHAVATAVKKICSP
jgi:competence protein ComFB